MDPAALQQLGLAGALVVAVLYLQRAQMTQLSKLVSLAKPSMLTLRIDPEQLEQFTKHREHLAEAQARIDQIEDRLARLSALAAE